MLYNYSMTVRLVNEIMAHDSDRCQWKFKHLGDRKNAIMLMSFIYTLQSLKEYCS